MYATSWFLSLYFYTLCWVDAKLLKENKSNFPSSFIWGYWNYSRENWMRSTNWDLTLGWHRKYWNAVVGWLLLIKSRLSLFLDISSKVNPARMNNVFESEKKERNSYLKRKQRSVAQIKMTFQENPAHRRLFTHIRKPYCVKVQKNRLEAYE